MAKLVTLSLWIMQLGLWTVASLRVLLNWLVHWPKQDSPDVDDKYDYHDQGGELYCNPKVVKIFKTFGYRVFPSEVTLPTKKDPWNGPTKLLEMVFILSSLVPILMPNSGLACFTTIFVFKPHFHI
jgi:hypothetical protein